MGDRVLAAPLAPVLAELGEGTRLKDFGPTLRWQNAPGAIQVQLQVIPALNDGPGVDLQFSAAISSYTLPAPPLWFGLLPDQTYSWRVRNADVPTPGDSNDQAWGPWAAGSFRTPVRTADTLMLVAPPPGGRVASPTPVLHWLDQQPDVYYYEVQLSRDPEFVTDPASATAAVYSGLVHGGVNVPERSYQVPTSAPLEPDVPYYWRVRPRLQGDAAPVPWSPANWFTVASMSSCLGPTKASSYSSAVLMDGPVGYWRLDEACGSTATDATRQGHTAILFGATSFGVAVSPTGSNGLVLNGGGHLRVPDSAVWEFGTHDFTLELWVNIRRFTPFQVLMAHDELGGNQPKWMLFSDGKTLVFHTNSPETAGRYPIDAPWQPALGTWHHVVLVRSGATFSLYGDGRLLNTAQESQLLPVPSASAPLTFGQGEDNFFLDGALADVAIYRRALTAPEVLTHFNATATPRS